MSLADYLTELADWNARNEKARDTYRREQANPRAVPTCRACGSELTLFRTCPCKEQS